MSYQSHTKRLQVTDESTETMQKPQIETEVLNVRLPESTIEILDQFIEKKIFSSRSEAIREFAREYILENNIKQ